MRLYRLGHDQIVHEGDKSVDNLAHLYKKCLKFIYFIVILAVPPRSFAGGDQFGLFKQYVTQASLKPFTRDLGGILGSAAFHNGRSLGFSGFDIGVHGGIQLRPERGNEILRRSGVGAFGLPWVQAEIGMPFRFDGLIRGISFQGLTIAGGGLRYGLLKVSDRPLTPQLLLSTVAHSVAHKDFSASHIGASLVASVGVPMATPYIGLGLDRTRVVVRAADTDPSLVGAVTSTLESHFTAGVSVRPYPFVYVQGAFTLAHGQPGFDTGFGIRF